MAIDRRAISAADYAQMDSDLLVGTLNTLLTSLFIAVCIYLSLISILERHLLEPLASSFDIDSYNYSSSSINNATSSSSSDYYAHSTMSLFFLLITALFVGWLVDQVQTPPLLGMLLVGIVFRNVPMIASCIRVDQLWAGTIRKWAFVIILLRGGLGLDAKALAKLKGACVRLALMPCTIEAIAIAIAAHFLLQFTLSFGLLLGFVVASVSPAVTVPCMLTIAEQGYGVDSGIPSLVIAASSVDNVFAITVFSLLLALIFSQGSILLTVIYAPLEVLAGCLYGVGVGLILWRFPMSSMPHRTFVRVLFLVSASMACMFGSAALHFDAVGAIGCLVSAFVAALEWKKNVCNQAITEETALAVIWNLFFQPLLFGLIGFELDLSQLGIHRLAMALSTLTIGLVFRSIVAYCAAFGARLRQSEQLFIVFAWLPKATVQAALAPIMLELVDARGLDATYVDIARTVLTVAVLSILVTAPIGAVCMRLFASRLLQTSSRRKPPSINLVDDGRCSTAAGVSNQSSSPTVAAV